MTAIVLIGSIGCALAILFTTLALAEIMASPTLRSEHKWAWMLALIGFTVVTAAVWFGSRSRAQHRPINPFDGSSATVSRGEFDALLVEIDAYRSPGHDKAYE